VLFDILEPAMPKLPNTPSKGYLESVKIEYLEYVSKYAF